jgi:hypothetical protein
VTCTSAAFGFIANALAAAASCNQAVSQLRSQRREA